MKFKFKSEGGLIRGMIPGYEDDDSNLSEEHRRALRSLFENAFQFQKANSNFIDRDAIYTIEMENGNEKRVVKIDDLHKPAQYSSLISYLLASSLKPK